MLFLPSFVGALAGVNAFATSGYSVFHSLEGVAPVGWTKHDDGSLDKSRLRIKLRIQLSQPRISEFYDVATRIATPGDALYAQHLSKKDADAFLAPKPESVSLVQDWLKREKLDRRAEVGSAGDSIVVRASVAEVERLLRTEYSTFVHQQSGRKILRTLQYNVPDILTSHIDVIEPTTFFGMKPMRLVETHSPPSTDPLAAGANCSNSSPACLSKLYRYGRAESYSKGRMGIAGFLGQFASHSDLSIFMKQRATQNNTDQGFTCVSINNGGCPADSPGYEANLDAQYARAITQKIPNVYYSTGGSPPANGNVTTNEPYLEFLNYLLALRDEDLPNTISISYGDAQPSVPDQYATKCCDLFAKLGARGVSVLAASGDTGVGNKCPGDRLELGFPASCPWITAVGGTDGTGPEKAWSGSGGGFSDLFPQPKYQAHAVNGWLKRDETHRELTPYFNASGRAIPDVAALGTAYPIVVNGETVTVDGTSASSPVFASIVQLLNSDRLSRGKKPLGFLNPWLYTSAASALTDIKHGVTEGCAITKWKGFRAVTGWDPATGLGTPDFEKLLKVSRQT